MEMQTGKRDIKEVKLQRRNGKGKFTRCAKILIRTIEESRPKCDIDNAFKEVVCAFENLQSIHEVLVSLIEDDSVFEHEEEWIANVEEDFLSLKIRKENCSESEVSTVNIRNNVNKTDDVVNVNNNSASAISNDVLSESEPGEFNSNVVVQSQGHSYNRTIFKVEKPKLPVFNGDIRDYLMFKADFKEFIEKQYSAREAVTILRSSLSGKPLDLVRGLSEDYEATWRYLDSVYGDPKAMADAVSQDLAKFRPLKDGDDSRFCDLYHIIHRSFNLLKQAGRQSDMDNNHVLAMIEQKLNLDDRRVWFRHLEGKDATLEGLLNWMECEMKTRMRASAPIRTCNSNKSILSVNQVASSEKSKYKSYKCWICNNDSHWIDNCYKLKNKQQSERMKLLKEKRACFSCLKIAGKGHNMTTCSRRKVCTVETNGEKCKYFHHPLLHKSDGDVFTGVAVVSNRNAVLPVLSAEIIGRKYKKQSGKILFDSGAQISIIREDVAKNLKLQGKTITMTISKVGGINETVNTKLYDVPVRSNIDGKVQTIKAVGLDHIADEESVLNLENISQHLKINSRELRRGSGTIDVLIGIDHPTLHIGPTKKLEDIVARKSELGWVLFGGNRKSDDQCKVLHISVMSELEMSQFWSTESMGVRAPSCKCDPDNLSPNERRISQEMENSCLKKGSQWEMPYPWLKDARDLPDNKCQAEMKLVSLEKNLMKKPADQVKMYNQQIEQMVEMNFARKLSEDEIENYQGPVHYVSHHPVLKPESKSTPLRVVFNSSSVYKGHRLNDYWHKGPDLLNNLFGVVIRFSENKIALCGDISKMYHRILVPEKDQHVHRFLWRNMKVDQKPDVYLKTVLTFGDKPAPAMAQTALRKTAKESAGMYPAAAKTLLDNTYMDDICDSVVDVSSGEVRMKEIDEILETGGFKVKEWICSGTQVGNDVQTFQQQEEKVLGLCWKPTNDTLYYKVNFAKNQQRLTKRSVLSQMSKIFDPIGFVAAVVIKAKIAVQKLWQLGLDWDTVMSSDEEKRWIKLFQELNNLNDVQFTRCLTPENIIGRPQLIVFCDASSEAFGTCAYLRWKVDDDKFEMKFIAAKSRVAPLKTLTIPRLELQAAVMGARLSSCLKKELRIETTESMFMTDSLIVLHWIKGSVKKYKPFVANRVSEIQVYSDPSEWKFIAGTQNPADDISRGIPVTLLSDRWETGPKFMKLPEDQWPEMKSDFNPGDHENCVEKIKEVKTVLNVNLQEEVIDTKKFSSLRKLIRVTAYVMRFVAITKQRLCSEVKDSSENEAGDQLTVQEIEESKLYWIKQAQKGLAVKELDSLSPFTDNEGVIRVGGRIKHADMSYTEKHPILLPVGHPLSMMIMRDSHNRGHYGIATTVAVSRQIYWIIKAHRLAKKIKYQCVICKKLNPKAQTPLMADLPDYRVAPFSPPFYTTACDYFGPIYVKLGRNKVGKHYGVLFTCLNTRAVHLELAVNVSTQEFLQVLRRFFAIRGKPNMMISDNGSQFVGAERELREMIQGWDKKRLKEYGVENGITWKFVTPLAPHHNGCAESLVKSCKGALKKAIGDQVLTPFELYTCLMEVMNLVNQRPIGRIPNDPNDGSYLCPNDMLLGRATSEVPQGPFKQSNNPSHRVELVQGIVSSFWKKWNRDVLPALVPRRKWRKDQHENKVGDVVVMEDPNRIRGKWTVGRIVQTYPGKDGKVRSVELKTSRGTFNRPVTKIATIYPVDGYGEDDQN